MIVVDNVVNVLIDMILKRLVIKHCNGRVIGVIGGYQQRSK